MPGEQRQKKATQRTKHVGPRVIGPHPHPHASPTQLPRQLPQSATLRCNVDLFGCKAGAMHWLQELLAALDVESPALSRVHVLVAQQLERLKVWPVGTVRMLGERQAQEQVCVGELTIASGPPPNIPTSCHVIVAVIHSRLRQPRQPLLRSAQHYSGPSAALWNVFS